MNMTRWLIVGISGTTCSGKTTLSKRLQESLKNSTLINQDNYFLPEDDPRHVHIPELNNFNNWEILTSLDTQKMNSDVFKIIGNNHYNYNNENNSTTNTNNNNITAVNGSNVKSKNYQGTQILILEGFLLFADKTIADLCDLKYFLTLSKQQCWERRNNRVYDPPDIPNYFELVVWPEYEKYLKDLKKDKKLHEDIRFIDGAANKDDIFLRVFNDINKRL